MNCIHDGILRQHLDGELAGAELVEVTDHLASCADCCARFEKLAAARAQTEEVLGMLAPADNVAINPAMAYAQFTNQFAADRRIDCHNFGECQSSSVLGAASLGYAAGSEDSGGYDRSHHSDVQLRTGLASL